MKNKLIATLGTLVIAACLLLLAPPYGDAQRGDLYGARALLALEQAFKTTGVLTYPNYAAAPVVCNAANRGVYYYDTTLAIARVCGAAGWVSAGITVGTAFTIPRWNTTPDDLEDSHLVDNDVPAAGVSGNVLVFDATFNAMDAAGGDVVNAVRLDMTNYDSANHTGGTFRALFIEGITEDPQATEIAIGIGAGFDQGILLPDGTVGLPAIGFTNETDTGFYATASAIRVAIDGVQEFAFSDGLFSLIPANGRISYANQLIFSETATAQLTLQDANAAAAGADLVTISSTLGIMNGADIVRGLFIDLTNADHTGGPDTNDLRAIEVDAIVNDDDTVEYVLASGSGFDADIWNIDTSLFLGSSTQIVSILDDTFGQIFIVDSAQAAGASNDWVTVVSNVGIMDGGDTARGLFVDLSNADHTGVTNVVAGLEVDAITGDEQARETGIIVESGFDVSVSSEGHIFQRENFQQGFRKNLASDFSAALDTDTSVNIVLGTNGVNFEYREELDKTVSSFILDNAGAIDISADNGAADNEGVEFMLGSSQTTTSGYLIAQTDQLCFTMNATVTLIAGTDQFVAGWRINAAYIGTNLYVGYAEYAVIGINNVDGSIFALSETATGPDTGSDDSDTNWANGETKTLKVCIDGAGLTHHYLDGTIVAEDDGANPNDFAMTATTNMVPFVSYLGITGTDAAILINWWEITAN